MPQDTRVIALIGTYLGEVTVEGADGRLQQPAVRRGSQIVTFPSEMAETLLFLRTPHPLEDFNHFCDDKGMTFATTLARLEQLGAVAVGPVETVVDLDHIRLVPVGHSLGADPHLGVYKMIGNWLGLGQEIVSISEQAFWMWNYAVTGLSARALREFVERDVLPPANDDERNEYDNAIPHLLLTGLVTLEPALP